MKKSIPVFIMSSERSGSNLLRVLLNNHNDLCAPLSPHLLNTFREVVPYYGCVPEHMNNLLADMESVVNHPFTDWKLDLPEDSADRLKNQTFMGAYDFIYREKAKQSGKNNYVSKDNDVFNHADLIFGFYENPKIIYLYRDVRDQAVSWMKTPTSMLTPKEVAQRWVKEQQECIKVCNENKAHCYSISYEKLTADTENIMKSVIDFIGLDWDENCAQTKKNGAPEAERNTFWKNLNQPVMSDNSKKFLKEFDNKTIKIIEAESKKILDYLGYDLVSNGHYQANKIVSRYWHKYWTRRSKLLRQAQTEDNSQQYSKYEQMLDLRNDKIGKYPYYF
jgi:hypothetical protein